MIIATDDPTRADVLPLLEEHLADMYATSPPESVHALDPQALAAPGVTFYTAREEGIVVSCAALKVRPEADAARRSVTVDDLNDFKRQFFFELKTLLKEYGGVATKKWLKSKDVRKMLNISPGTLQNLRINGSLPYTRVGGVIYYEAEDIQKMLTDHKTYNN